MDAPEGTGAARRQPTPGAPSPPSGTPPAPDPGTAPVTEHGAPPDVLWTELADAAWLGAFWIAADRPLPASASPAEPAPGAPPTALPGAGPPARSGPGTAEGGTGPAVRGSGADPSEAPPHVRPDPGGDVVLALPPPRLPQPRRREPAVSGTLPLARALRRLARRRPSAHLRELDEERTADRVLDGASWLPVLRPVPERALDLVVLVDAGRTMRVWERETRGLAEQAALSGAFRDVRTVSLALSPDGPAALLRPGGRHASPAELLDPRGERAFLLVTDGLGDGWTSVGADRLLRRLAGAGPCALVHLLPTHLRHRSALRPFPATLAASGFGRANTTLTQVPDEELDDPLRTPPAGGAGDQVLVPVLSLKAASLASWADLVAGGPGARRRCQVVQAGTLAKEPPAPGLTYCAGSAEAAVRTFTSLATPTARRLASQLAAVPLELDTIRAVQRLMLPSSGPDHLAEILMGGLLEWPGRDGAGVDFADGVREVLLAGGTRSELAAIVSCLAELPPGRPDPRAVRLRAALSDPDLAPLPDPAGTDRAWLRLELAVLEALSGPHARRARRLREALEHPGPLPTAHRRPDSKGGSAMDPEPSRPAGGRHGPPGIKGPMPPRNAHFIGRADMLATVAEQLEHGELAAVLPHALHGTGGVGKSQIAIEYVYQHQHEFDVVWWIPAEQQSMVLSAFAALARALGLTVGPQPGTAVPRVLEALRDGDRYGRWLLIFDNAEDVDGVRPFIPTSGNGKVIVTSRNRAWEGVATSLTVDVFRREESRDLLMRRSPTLGEDEADRLASALGDLPLAIELAAAWHAASQMPVDRYLALLERHRTELDTSGLVHDYPSSVAAAWLITLAHLQTESPGVYQLLGVCGCLAAEPVPLSIFRSGGRISVSRELDPILRDPIRLSRAIRELSKFSLIRVDHRRDAIQMHRLMQSVLRTTTEPAEREGLLHAAHALLAAAKPAGSPSSPGHWDGYQALLPHAVSSQAAASHDGWVRDLVASLVYYLYYWGDHEQAVDLAGQAWRHWNEDTGIPDTLVIQMAKLYAFCQRIIGVDRDAFSLNERALAVSRRPEVPEEELIDSMWQMAGAHRYRGDFTAARALDEDAFERARALFGPDDPDTLKAAHSYGVSLRMCGEFRAARALDEETARQWELVYGHADGFTLNTRNGLSIDIRECGDFPRARRLQEDVYAAYRSAFGSENPATIRAARNLAVCRRRDGALDAAWELSEHVFQLFVDKCGRDHSDTLASAVNVMVDRRIGGELHRSRAIGQDTADRYDAALGPDHMYTLITRANLAATHRALGETDRARTLDEAALARLYATVGPDHPNTLAVAMGYAADLHLDGAHERAVAEQEVLLPRLTAVCGADHPVTLALHANLATDLTALGRPEQARAHTRIAVDGLARVVGAGHDWLLAARDGRRVECDTAAMPL
ncbi:FxSxx-COOH system tetratricopeptide repeat protein [Streptomyces sp. NBC_00582]|uniref:FxSxx-COOH system tetratricopeptide repeat protein n=1 Tax=Streptomyces sp. NBC_00582 TaxID=2975783 RepID=UPI002E7FF980|nr:FxSxx-COOH system tetratricopeptide repeat protein [Streptomyces sp. NBC_00582]WUB60338.1 FxSxx-COOH system tetratricopeptide repeat protein [Streptomyces sp. NBC_00582]